MPTIVDKQATQVWSTPVLVCFTSLSLRLMENWRQLIAAVSGKKPDYERTMILGAIITLGTERLLRAEVEPQFRSLGSPLPAAMHSVCYVSSIAAAVGLNRDTARRKVNELIADQLAVRVPYGGVEIGPGLLELPILLKTLQAQLELLRRTVDVLLNLDVMSSGCTDERLAASFREKSAQTVHRGSRKC